MEKTNIISEQDLQQGSTKWLNWRLQKIGSSEIAIVIGESPYKTPFQLWEEKTGLVPPPDLSNNFAVKRGQELEPIARKLFNETMNTNFNPASFNHDEYSWAGYSSDGFDAELNQIIEIKCMSEKKHIECIETNQPPAYYKAQLHWGMWLSGAECCYFISYNPSHPTPLHYFKVMPDKEYIDHMINEAKKFWHFVETKTHPPLSDADYNKIENIETKRLADMYLQAKTTKENAEKMLNALTEKIKEISNGHRIKFFGIKATPGKRKGSIDYSKIPQLENIDLEQYRKPEIDTFRID